LITLPERIGNRFEAQKKLMEQHAADFRVACPGIIQSFNSSKQTVTVQLALRERINIDGVTSWEEIPTLLDVPVFMPRAGGYSLTMPITSGDECLVIFGDNCMDAWYQSGGVQNQIDKRRHDLSDGYALIGVWSQPNVISGYSTSSAQLRNDAGTALVEVSGTTINITTNGTTNISGGAVNISGTTTIQDKVFLSHTHSGVESGSGTTGGVA